MTSDKETPAAGFAARAEIRIDHKALAAFCTGTPWPLAYQDYLRQQVTNWPDLDTALASMNSQPKDRGTLRARVHARLETAIRKIQQAQTPAKAQSDPQPPQAAAATASFRPPARPTQAESLLLETRPLHPGAARRCYHCQQFINDNSYIAVGNSRNPRSYHRHCAISKMLANTPSLPE